MSGWGQGYITDITYLPGYYRHQSPGLMAIAAWLGGAVCPIPGPDDEVSYLELGCGQGHGALVLAASNPRWNVTAVDFNPAHVAAARERAARAGINNVRFIEADLATLADSPSLSALAEADFVSSHGVWSWVPPAVKSGLVCLLRAKLKPGAALHISYNALPGWSGVYAFQRLLREAGSRLGSRSDKQVEEGLRLVRDLNAAEARHLRLSPMVQALLERANQLPIEYLAHEYMNASWAPCWHAEVAEALAAAKLEWVASANLPENFPELATTEAQRAIVNRFDDPLVRELIRDICMERTLRHDIFIRGARRMDPVARDAELRRLTLVATIPEADLPAEVQMPAGKASLAEKFYRPIMRRLEAGPATVSGLLELPDLEGNRNNPSELVGVLVGMGFAEPMLRPGVELAEPARALNVLTARTPVRPERLTQSTGAASHSLGCGVSASPLDLFVVDRVFGGEDESSLPDWVRSFGPTNEESRVKMHEALEKTYRTRLPILRLAGVL